MNDVPLSRPFREGLFETDPPRLIGSACRACGARAFPARPFCPACDSDQVDGGVQLARTGRLYSFTTIRQAPPGTKVPYNLAYVDLDDGVRVMAQVEGDPGDLRIGMELELGLRPMGQRDGAGLVGYGFVPAGRNRGEDRQ